MADNDKKTRNTQQRVAIMSAIHESSGPLSVQEIHEAAQENVENIGIATVYRNIKILLTAGEIQAVILADGVTRYERAGLKHHHHFRCRGCTRVFDLDVCPISIPDGSTLPGGFRVDDHEVTLYGLCPECAHLDTDSDDDTADTPVAHEHGPDCDH